MTTVDHLPAAFADLNTPEPLEARFGNPDDQDNPLGFAAFLAADERGDLSPAGERMLDSYGLGAEFVPVSLGGRLGQVDRLARVLRPMFRRDAALALGHGASNLVGAVNVWCSGDAAQRRWLADLLLRNERIAAGYTDLVSGNDLTRTDFHATVRGDQLRLSGRKEVVNNLTRAQAVHLLARTSDQPGSRSHSLLLVDMASVPRDRLRYLPRYRTAGVRGVYLGGLEFTDCPLPLSAVAGEFGEALETILRAFQVTRSALPSAGLGAMEQQLRTVTDFALGRRLYGRSVVDLPQVKAVLAGAFLDILICDSLATTVCRALHVLPRQTSIYAAATKYLVPKLMRESVDRLAVVLGARSFLREGPFGIFQKHLRDLPVASLVHAGGTVCQATMIPQLPRLARQSWLAQAPPPPLLFRLADPLPELDFGPLEITAGRCDGIMAALPELAKQLRGDPVLGPLTAQFVGELRELKQRCTELAPRDRSPLAGPVSFDLTERYGLVLAASACLGIWRHNQDHPNPFMRDTAWLVGALRRLADRLGLTPVSGTDSAVEPVFAELAARHETGHGFDLIGRRLA